MSLHPTVLWAQRPDLLLLTIPLQDATEVAIKVDGENLSFSAVSGGKNYACTLTLFGAIISEESSNITRPRQIELKLTKKDASKEYWPRLTQSKGKSAYIQIDWNRWKDEDDDGSSAKSDDLGDFGMGGGMGGFDMQQMLAQMGGGGGGGLGGGFDSAPPFGSAAGQSAADPGKDDHEDEEDMPALENE